LSWRACNPNYATVQLVDGANINAMTTIGSIRGSAQDIQTQIGNLEQDSHSSDSGLNSEVSVQNKINTAGVMTLRTVQDSNKLLAPLLEMQTNLAKQQRESTTNAINADIQRQSSLNMTQMTGTLTGNQHVLCLRRPIGTESVHLASKTVHSVRRFQ
jgi:hypothetical protein